MYGLINNALKSMISEQYGDTKWEQVLRTSGVVEDSFLATRRYDDAVTYALVGAAAEVLDAPIDTCLEMFGEYWVLETATRSYGMLMDASGVNLVDFLQNLDALHDRITSTFLDYIPPSFSIEQVAETRYHVHYISERQGLIPFVRGLLKGLAIRFNADMRILSIEEVSTAKGTHAVFELELMPQ